MNAALLDRLRLDGQPADPSRLQVFQADGTDIIEGLVWAGNAWYRIEHAILDALPESLASFDRRSAFADRHGLPRSLTVAQSLPADGLKRDQIAFFQKDAATYDREVSHRSFYVASDRIAFGDWMAAMPAGALACDIGAGSGRLTLPMAQRGFSVVSTDVSEEMLRVSRERAARTGLLPRISYILADADRLPFAPGIFDVATCYGALHHIPEPRAVIREAVRVLRPGGHWFSYDPHRSRVRFVFDWMMRIASLYEELSTGNPHIGAEEMARWCADAGLMASIRLHFFLPPHLLNLISADRAERWLRVSDRLFNAIGLGSWAGVIVVSGETPADQMP